MKTLESLQAAVELMSPSFCCNKTSAFSLCFYLEPQGNWNPPWSSPCMHWGPHNFVVQRACMCNIAGNWTDEVDCTLVGLDMGTSNARHQSTCRWQVHQASNEMIYRLLAFERNSWDPISLTDLIRLAFHLVFISSCDCHLRTFWQMGRYKPCACMRIHELWIPFSVVISLHYKT